MSRDIALGARDPLVYNGEFVPPQFNRPVTRQKWDLDESICKSQKIVLDIVARSEICGLHTTVPPFTHPASHTVPPSLAHWQWNITGRVWQDWRGWVGESITDKQTEMGFSEVTLWIRPTGWR